MPRPSHRERIAQRPGLAIGRSIVRCPGLRIERRIVPRAAVDLRIGRRVVRRPGARIGRGIVRRSLGSVVRRSAVAIGHGGDARRGQSAFVCTAGAAGDEWLGLALSKIETRDRLAGRNAASPAQVVGRPRQRRALRILGEPRVAVVILHGRLGQLLIVRATLRLKPHELLVVDDGIENGLLAS